MSNRQGEIGPEQKTTFYGSIEVPPRPPANQEILQPQLELFPSIGEYELPAVEANLADRLEALAREKLDLTRPPEHIKGDYAVPMFQVLKNRGRDAVIELAEDLKRTIGETDLISGARVEGPYLNIDLNAEAVGTAIVRHIEAMGENYGLVNIGDGQTAVLDTSSPNIAKQMTVAHLRSTVIGESLGRIYQNCGYEVIRDNHLGDWGTQFGILGQAYELWGHEVPDLQEGGDPIKGLLELYVRMNKAIEEEKTSEETSDLQNQGQEWFKKLEDGDPEARKLWEWALGISLVEVNRIYERLGSNFEYILGESRYIGMLPSVINAMEEAGLAQMDDKGRKVVDFGPDSKIKPLPIQKSDGASLYATRDIATLAAREEWFKPAKILYVVGGEQSHYFEQVFEAFNRYSKTIGEPLPQTEHVSFGMVKLPEGKMSTRRGNVVFLEDVLNEAVSRAEKVIRDRTGEDETEFSEAEIAEIAEQIGVGAVIYSELRQSRGRSIEFNWEEVLSFTGNSGPYLQYTNARINAIFRKLGNYTPDLDAPLKLSSPSEEKLALTLGEFPQAIKQAHDKNEPSIVAEYLHELSSAYNSFYKTSPVISEPDLNTKDTRIRLCRATSTVLKRGMSLLAIPMPERM